jgi:hypothetical protein
MKHTMRKILSCIAFLIMAMVTFNGCQTNLCQNISCQNNGTCREGACACPTGYEGSYCQDAFIEKFIGLWEGYERCNGGVQTYTRYICTPGNSPSEFIVTPFDDQVFKIIANVVPGRSKEFVIPQQTFYKNLDKYTFEGSGKVEKENYVYLYLQKTNPLGQLNSCYVEGEIKYIP